MRVLHQVGLPVEGTGVAVHMMLLVVHCLKELTVQCFVAVGAELAVKEGWIVVDTLGK